MSETITENAAGFWQRNWKWLLAGGAAVLALVFFMKRRAGGSALPSDSAVIPAPSNPSGTVDLSGVAEAIGTQNEMIAALAGMVQESNQQTAETLSGYQSQIATNLSSFQTQVSNAVTANTNTVAAAVTSSNQQVAKTLTTLTEAVTKPAAPKVDSVEASKQVSNPVKSVALKTWVDDNQSAGYVNRSVQVNTSDPFQTGILAAKEKYYAAEQSKNADAMKAAAEEAKRLRLLAKAEGVELPAWAR